MTWSSWTCPSLPPRNSTGSSPSEFLAEVKRVLSPDGVLSFSLGHYENYVSPELARMLASAGRSLQASFPNVLVIPGGRVFFLASDGPLFDDIAARIEQRGIKTKLVNRHYLDAMLTADRMADMQRAIAQPAALNRDFSPVLYYYHLRHWMSQFNIGFGVLQVLLLVLLCVYLVRLRGTALCPLRLGFCGVGVGNRPAAGVPGSLRLGLSSTGHHRHRLHGRPGAWRAGGEPCG